MKAIRAILLLLAIGLSVYGQAVGVKANKIKGSATAPSGACSAQDVQLTTAGVLWTCASGTWASSGGGTTINSTNGQVPYRFNSTTFADSGIAYSSGMIGIQVTPTVAQFEINSQDATRQSLILRAYTGTSTGQNVFTSLNAAGGTTAALTAAGQLTLSSNLILSGQVQLPATQFMQFGTRLYIQSQSDGALEFGSNGGGSTTPMLKLGGTTSSFTALKRNGTSLDVRLADDSDFAPLSAATVQHKAYTVTALPAASSFTGAMAYVTDANATTRLSTVAGGGSNKVVVFSDGTNWLIL